MFFNLKILRAISFFLGVSKSHPPSSLTTTSPTYHHHPTIFFWIPQPWWELSKAGFDFQFMIEAKQLPGVPPGGFFFGKSWRTSKGLQMGKMGPVQNKWSQNKWSVSLGVFLFHPTYVKVIKLFHRPLYNWRPILWHFDVGKLLESWDPRGTKFLKQKKIPRKDGGKGKGNDPKFLSPFDGCFVLFFRWRC